MVILAIIRAHKLLDTIGDTLVFSVSNNIFLPVRRHRRLFLDLMALPAVLSAAFYLFKCLAVAPDDVVATAGLYPSLLDMSIYDFMATWLESDHRLLPVVYLVAGMVVRLVTYVATISAAVAAASYESGQEWEEELEQEHDNEEEDEDEEEEEEMEEEEETEKERQHYTLLSFLGTVKSNLARPAKIICSNWALRVALDFLLGKLDQGLLDKAEFIYPTMLVIFLVDFICEVAVIVSVAEEPAGESAVGRACRLIRDKYEEFLLYRVGQSVIYLAFLGACALVSMAGLPQQMDAGVTCLLLGAKEVFSVANLTGYYFACRKKEKHKHDKACHID
jgi:hypothetical protein